MFKRILIIVITALTMLGLMGLQPANADDVTAHFTASWNASAEATAEATAVAIAGADATGKLLLEEERERSPHQAIKELTPPTEAEVMQYGTPVNSFDQSQRVFAAEVKAYDNVLNAAKVKLAKFQEKKKFFKNNKAKVRKLKKKIAKAKKHLNQVQTSWKYIPLLRADQGTCGRNTGRTGNMILRSFVDCIRAADGEEWKAIGFVPDLRQAVVVGVKFTNGTYRAGCRNFWYFDIPEDTPDESVVLVVESFARVILTVFTAVRVQGEFTLTGELKRNGVTCDTDSKTIKVDELIESETVTVRETDTDRAMAIGQERVQADAKARAEAQQSVAAELQLKLKEELDLQCEITPENPAPRASGPTVNDVLVNNTRTMTFTGKLAPGTSGVASASAGTGTIVDERRKTLAVDQNGYFSVTFTYRAGDEPGRDTVTVVVDQSDGQSVTATTMGRDAAGNTVPHFEVRAAPVDPT